MSLLEYMGILAAEVAGVTQAFAYDDDFANQGSTLLNKPEGFGGV